MDRVSVVIPTYNRRLVIGRALRSVLAQTLQPQEIIVVDDGSTDGTAEYLEADYPGVTVVRQSRRGAAAARNAGIARARGDLIAFLDSDDLWLPDKLRTQLEYFGAHPGLGLLATQKYKNVAALEDARIQQARARFFAFSSFLKRTMVNTPTVLIPRRVLERVGGFDESLTTSEDWDLWARIAYRYPVARIDTPLTAVFESGDSISRSRKIKYCNDVLVLARWNPGMPDTYDTDHRLAPLVYHRFVASFTIFRALRLLRHESREDALCFLEQVKDRIGFFAFPDVLIRVMVRPEKLSSANRCKSGRGNGQAAT